MKRTLLLLIAITVFGGFNTAQSQGKTKWKEMDAFHEVMAKTFHPAEEGKLEPIKARSQEMLDKATAWKNSTPPEGYNTKEVKTSLKNLVKGAKQLNKLVKGSAPDKEITEKLSALHDVFHELMEK